MGWFLPIGKRKSSRRRPAARAAAPRRVTRWDPNRTLAGLEALAAVVVLLGLLLTWRLSEKYLTNFVHSRQLPKIGAKQVELAEVPPWMGHTTQVEICTLVAAHVSPDVLDNASLEHAVLALAASPWVDHVQRVQRLDGGRVRVLAAYRQPIGVVETPKSLRLVDISGICLPGDYSLDRADVLTADGLPLIRGVSQPPPSEGELWHGDDLHAGLELIRLLRTEPYYAQARAFDVGQRDARGRISLVIETRKGRIIWGLPPGQEKAVEAEAAIKKIRLAGVYKRYHTIDTGGDMDIYQVDAFSAMPRRHEPTTEERSLSVGYTWTK